MIRDTPGRASPGELAQEMGVSNAGVTGRLESMEKKGWLKRMPGAADRRRVEVEATREGLRLWREAMALRGSAEHDVGTALTKQELATLNQLLKKMTLYIEKHRPKRCDVGRSCSSGAAPLHLTAPERRPRPRERRRAPDQSVRGPSSEL